MSGSRVVLGLLIGLAVPPILTTFVILPNFRLRTRNEIHNIRHEIEYLGWNVRHLQEERGYKEDQMYSPDSYYQSRY
ncbi:hypothetical protein DFJ63DRAFT_161864 [Scheffersomyces coipomensis]|uniref:uncharacterized protein n=1 Tax=Scheffersomyces coipomensis TaxID=1788519 RepID=UPI00315D1FCC